MRRRLDVCHRETFLLIEFFRAVGGVEAVIDRVARALGLPLQERTAGAPDADGG